MRCCRQTDDACLFCGPQVEHRWQTRDESDSKLPLLDFLSGGNVQEFHTWPFGKGVDPRISRVGLAFMLCEDITTAGTYLPTVLMVDMEDEENI